MLDLPGINKEHIKLTIEGEHLDMVAWRKDERDTHQWTTHRTELNYGKVERRFRIPENVDVKKITSCFDNGVLHLKMPKKTTDQQGDVRKIAIN